MLSISPIPLFNGSLGLCACPGADGAVFGRAEPDGGVDALARWPATAVVTLMESRELEILGMGDLPVKIRERIPLWLHLPIRDCDTPAVRWMERWRVARLLIAALLAEGGNVAVHCLAGVGRTGTVAAMCLVDAGFGNGRDSLAHVRNLHHVRAAETPEQEAFVARYHPKRTLAPDTVHDELAALAEESGVGSILNKSGRVDMQVAARMSG